MGLCLGMCSAVQTKGIFMEFVPSSLHALRQILIALLVKFFGKVARLKNPSWVTRGSFQGCVVPLSFS